METFLLMVLGLFAGWGMLTAGFLAYCIGREIYYQVILARGLERDLGFRHGTTGLPADNLYGYIKIITIESVTESGVFEQAGIRAGDVLPDFSESDLFKSLHRHRGREVELPVVDGGPGLPFPWRPRRLIRVVVPPRVQPH